MNKAALHYFRTIVKPHMQRMLIIHTWNMGAAQPLFTRRLSRELETAACVPEQVGDQLTDALEQIAHNKSHYIGDAYLVGNGRVNMPEDLALKLFRQFGAFNGKARWEQ